MSVAHLPATQPFVATGELPGPGITVIEASAGTGKTHTLTSLLVRYVAQGTPLASILAVTFTRMATGELRERIRERMVAVHGALSLPAGTPVTDEVAVLLADCSAAELDVRRERLAAALAEFDSATIATIHGFCHLAISGLGSTGDAAPGTVLLEDASDLRAEVVEDLYLRERLSRPTSSFTLDEAGDAAELAVREPAVRIVPPPGDDPAGRLARLAENARREVAARLLSGGFITYDDMLHRLACTLDDPDRGPLAARRLSDRYRIVVVDEFQDTDPVQWRILQQAFGRGDTTLILIGDPKQAIYAFRGADVLAYLDAAERAERRYTLQVNRRSDQGLLDALATFLDPLQFGHPDIPYRPVDAPAGAPLGRLSGAPIDTPLRFRVVADNQRDVTPTKKGLHQKDSLLEWIAADVSADVAALLASPATITSAATITSGDDRPASRLRASDVAVLTRTNRQATIVRDALTRAGVPAVVAGSESVFASEATAHWLVLLDGLLEPASPERAAAVALSPFVGLTPAEVAIADEARWEQVHDRLLWWSALATSVGIAVAYQHIVAETDLPRRLLQIVGGERLLTDLGHVAHLLHAQASEAQSGPAGLRVWLAARRELAAEEQTAAEDRSRRLDSDADAVQVLTIHKVKGLEFPVVYCPFLWDAGREPAGVVVVHEASERGIEERIIDIGCPAGSDASLVEAHEDRIRVAASEGRGEDLRLMYVALTRARHQLVLWWGRPQGCRKSPLARVLLGRRPGSGEVSDLRSEPKTADVLAALEAMAARAPGLISVERPAQVVRGVAAGATASSARHPAAPEPAALGGATPDPAALDPGSPSAADGGADGESDAVPLAVATFGRRLDHTWVRASYSSLSSAAHATSHQVGSEPEDPGVSDEPDPAGAPTFFGGDLLTFPAGAAPPDMSAALSAAMAAVSPFAGIPGGRDTGTAVHRLLERVDFSLAPQPIEMLRRVVGDPTGEIDGLDPSILATGLSAALTTPLGPLVGGRSLSDIGRSDRLDELAFELPVAGGDRADGWMTASAIADALESHLTSSGPLVGYPDKLRNPALESRWRGYLTGSLDLVFRCPSYDGRIRWYLADYKTNQLAPAETVTTAWHYRQSALDVEMQRSHYPLQALIYTVALHRYLRWRQPGYDPEEHLGGVLYLFLRGMVGPDAPSEDGRYCGVFSWEVPPALVVELSDLFERGARRVELLAEAPTPASVLAPPLAGGADGEESRDHL